MTHQTATKKHEKMVDYLEFDSSFYTNHTRYYFNVEFVRGCCMKLKFYSDSLTGRLKRTLADGAVYDMDTIADKV